MAELIGFLLALVALFVAAGLSIVFGRILGDHLRLQPPANERLVDRSTAQDRAPYDARRSALLEAERRRRAE